LSGPRRIARLGFERAEAWLDRVFGPAWNPLSQLGALGWFFYWIVVVSGLYLYAFFDTGVDDAYESLERITHGQWYAGGVMRSLHRYASDALVVVVMLHLAREFVMGRFRGARWFSWFTGVPMLWFVFASGITGYWLVWDQLAQYVAIASTEWLDALPLFGEPIARNFLDPSTLSGRFFTLMVFLHIAVPLFLLFIMWVHIHRITRPAVNPPRGLAAGLLATMIALSLLRPALSHGPANLDTVPAVVSLDWFYLALYPLLDLWPGLAVWALVIGGTLALLVVPWLSFRPQTRRPVAVVDLENCNGCGRCEADCPFTAVTMAPRTDGRAFAEQALVDPALCVSCGICAGACPTATPYRRRSALVPGIDLPDFTVRDLRARTDEAAAALAAHGQENDRVMVYGCEHGPDLDSVSGPGVAVVRLRCAAHLPPAFVDLVLSRRHADGVLLAGCREGACHFRHGIRWTHERIAGTRDPYLRARVPRERLATGWCGVGGERRLARELEAFRARLRQAAPGARASAAAPRKAS